MATFYISPFTKIGPKGIQAPAGHKTPQTITTSASSARNSTDFDDDVEFIRVRCSAAIHYSLGDDTVTATTSDHYIPADTTYDISIDNNTRIAVINA